MWNWRVSQLSPNRAVRQAHRFTGIQWKAGRHRQNSRLERQYLVRCLYLVRYHCSMLTHAKATERHSPRSPKYSSPNFSSRLRPSTSPAPHESSVEWFNIAGRASPSLQLAPKPLELAHVGRVRADPGPHYMRWRQVDARMLLG